MLIIVCERKIDVITVFITFTRSNKNLVLFTIIYYTIYAYILHTHTATPNNVI